jgi:hypothetical protein
MSSIYGPVHSIPENYKPEVMISDEEFNSLYSSTEKPTFEQQFRARDYSVAHFNNYVNTALSEDKSVVDHLSELPEERLRSLFWGLVHCSCCWRHCHNVPVAIDTKEELSMLEVATTDMINDYSCFCHCRSGKRFLRQAFFNKK